MDYPYDFEKTGRSAIAYVRSVKTSELPDQIRAQAGDLKHLFAVCDAEGHRLALVRDRNHAFALARQNDLAPVSVH